MIQCNKYPSTGLTKKKLTVRIELHSKSHTSYPLASRRWDQIIRMVKAPVTRHKRAHAVARSFQYQLQAKINYRQCGG